MNSCLMNCKRLILSIRSQYFKLTTSEVNKDIQRNFSESTDKALWLEV